MEGQCGAVFESVIEKEIELLKNSEKNENSLKDLLETERTNQMKTTKEKLKKPLNKFSYENEILYKKIQQNNLQKKGFY